MYCQGCSKYIHSGHYCRCWQQRLEQQERERERERQEREKREREQQQRLEQQMKEQQLRDQEQLNQLRKEQQVREELDERLRESQKQVQLPQVQAQAQAPQPGCEQQRTLPPPSELKDDLRPSGSTAKREERIERVKLADAKLQLLGFANENLERQREYFEAILAAHQNYIVALEKELLKALEANERLSRQLAVQELSSVRSVDGGNQEFKVGGLQFSVSVNSPSST